MIALRSAGTQLDAQVRQTVQCLGCSRRGCRAGRRVHLRTARVSVNETVLPGEIPTVTTRPLFRRDSLVLDKVNNRRSAVHSAVAMTSIVRERGRGGGILEMYAGRRVSRTPVLTLVDIVSAITVVITDRPATTATCTASVARPPSTLVRVARRPPSVVNIGQLNARSVGNKSAAINDLIVSRQLDVLAVVESWHDAVDSPSLIAATPPCYRYVERARPRTINQNNNNHGGICVFVRSHFLVRHVPLPNYNTFEVLLLTLRHGALNATILTLYRPGSRAITDNFFKELGDVLERCSKYSQCYIVGDVNVHLDDMSSVNTRKFQQALADFGLQDRVGQATHRHSHQLDVFVMRDDCFPLSVDVQPPLLSDHSFIVVAVDTCAPAAASDQRPRVRRRRWAAFNSDDFINALNESPLLLSPPSDVDELFACYDSTVSDILDKLAPFADVKQYARPTSPWYDRDCYVTKLQTRRLEKAYRRHPGPTTLARWREQFKRQRVMFQQKFVSHWSDKISSCAGDSKRLWSRLKCLLSPPESTVAAHSAGDLARHFSMKIDRIRQSTAGFKQPLVSARCINTPLDSFTPVTAAEVAAIIRKSPSKQCVLDPMPTWLLKITSDTMAPVIATMCNASITQNKFPAGHKCAVVRPLLKKPTLDPSDLNSFRPISNLSFVSKILERVIDSRLADHANWHGLFSPVQSAYRKYHSTETALVKVHNDLVGSVDRGHVGAIALLDLSSAFDTVDHLVLLDVLQNRFGVTGPALAWFNSYLSDRTQIIHVSGESSGIATLSCGVPQGSVLGPKMFIAYTEDIDEIFAGHALQHHCFADDTQTYVSGPTSQVQSIAPCLQHCIADVANWCGSRRLQLNAAKTELMWFGSTASLRSLSQSSRTVVIGSDTLQPVESVRNLGVHLDSKLSMQTHVAKLTQTCFFQLRRLRQIRRLLGRDVTANVVAALVLTRLDYGNALLAGLPYSTIAPLQRVINAATRLVHGLRPRDHVTDATIKLHWLPICARIQYKLCLLVHRALIGQSPSYVAELLQPVTTRHSSLRSADSNALLIPRTSLKFGERAFSVAGPAAWNILPTDIRTTTSTPAFKKKLKTFLFAKFYGSTGH